MEAVILKKNDQLDLSIPDILTEKLVNKILHPLVQIEEDNIKNDL